MARESQKEYMLSTYLDEDDEIFTNNLEIQKYLQKPTHLKVVCSAVIYIDLISVW